MNDDDIQSELNACRECVEKNGYYLPEDKDGEEEYVVKMSARFYLYWVFRERHLIKNQGTASLIAFCQQQQHIARERIRTHSKDIRDKIECQIKIYEEKEARYGASVQDADEQNEVNDPSTADETLK